MDAIWSAWAQQNGTVEMAEPARHARQLAALEDGSAAAVLSDFALLKVEGEEAEAFLQGQLSSDIRLLNEAQAQFSSYSTAKGRMLASFLIWKRTGAYYLMVSADIAAAIQKRLTMFVMRAKVKVQLADEWTLLGLNEKAARATLPAQWAAAAHLTALQVAQSENGLAVALPCGGALLALQGSGEWNQRLQDDADLQWVSPAAWALKDIRAGIAWVRLATQEQFVPQMANMELIGAVSFKKGCYPGQEIVARTQYLGKVKRRLFRVSASAEMSIGDKLYSPQAPGQSIGMVAAICPLGDGVFEGLAVAQAQAWESGVYLDEEGNIPLACLSLPYSLEENAAK